MAAIQEHAEVVGEVETALASEAMRRIAAVSCIALALSFISPRSRADLGEVSGLARGDSIEILFETRGCFHHETYEIILRRDAGFTAEVFSVEGIEWLLPLPAGVRTRLGELRLSDEDLAGLDRLLAYYRSRHGGGCTTSETVQVGHVFAGSTLQTETFVDSSCGTSFRRGQISFDALVDRAERAGGGRRSGAAPAAWGGPPLSAPR